MLNRMKLPAKVSLLAGLVALAGPGLVAARAATGTGAIVSPEEVIGRLRLVGANAAASAKSPSAALNAILDGHSYPGGCVTPLLIALSQASPRLEGGSAALLRRLGPIPTDPPLVATSVPDGYAGSFRLHYSEQAGVPGALSPDDDDLDGVPDEALRIITRLEEARRAVLASFEQTATPAFRPDTDEGIHDVEITDLPGEIAGYVWQQGGQTLMVLDHDKLSGPEGDAVMRHQFTHLLQLGLTADESPWWYEAHAIWAEDPGGRDAGRRANAVADYLESAGRGFEPDHVSAWEGSFLWPHYLLWSGGAPQILGAIWEEMAAVPGNNTLSAMSTAIGRFRSDSFEEEVRRFRIWNIFLGSYDDGGHYPFGADLRGPVGAHESAYPAIWQGRGPVGRLGAEVLQLTANSSPGGWLMEFEGDPLARWDVTLLTIPSYAGAHPGLAMLPVEDGTGSVAVPWKDLAGVLVVVQNLGSERPEPARFRFQAAYDPLVPFDLMSFSATDEGDGSVALRWHTEKEVDMLGWRLYRSRDPLTGFEPVDALLIPAVGGPEATSYMFIDSSATPGQKYYYLLEGITEQGFRETAYPVAVRLRAPGATAD